MSSSEEDADLINGDHGLDKRRIKGRGHRRRVSHTEEFCPCRMRGGGDRRWPKVVLKSGGDEENDDSEEPDKICVVNECSKDGGPEGRRGSRRNRLTSSLDRRRSSGKGKKRYSVTSTSSSVSMLSREESQKRRTEDEDTDGDCNNNNWMGRNNDAAENRRNEAKEQRRGESINSSSSFTKEIMLIIHNTSQRTDGGGVEQVTDENYRDRQGEENKRKLSSTTKRYSITATEGNNQTLNEDAEYGLKDRRPSEVVLKMNRRNSDMSEKRQMDKNHIICECQCHEKSKRPKTIEIVTRKQKSPNSPTLLKEHRVNIYSIEEPKEDGHESGIEKGQLENRSDNDSDYERRFEGEYDNDEIEDEEGVQSEEEVEKQNSRRLGDGRVL